MALRLFSTLNQPTCQLNKSLINSSWRFVAPVRCMANPPRGQRGSKEKNSTNQGKKHWREPGPNKRTKTQASNSAAGRKSPTNKSQQSSTYARAQTVEYDVPNVDKPRRSDARRLKKQEQEHRKHLQNREKNQKNEQQVHIQEQRQQNQQQRRHKKINVATQQPQPQHSNADSEPADQAVEALQELFKMSRLKKLKKALRPVHNQDISFSDASRDFVTYQEEEEQEAEEYEDYESKIPAHIKAMIDAEEMEENDNDNDNDNDDIDAFKPIYLISSEEFDKISDIDSKEIEAHIKGGDKFLQSLKDIEEEEEGSGQDNGEAFMADMIGELSLDEDNGQHFTLDEVYNVLTNTAGVRDIAVLDVGKKTRLMETLIVVTCTTSAQQLGLSKHLAKMMEDEHRPVPKFDDKESEWVMLESGKLIVNFMSAEARMRFELDKLWALRVTQMNPYIDEEQVANLPEYFAHYPPPADEE